MIKVERQANESPEPLFFINKPAAAFVGPELAAAAGAALAGLAIDQIGKAIEEESEKLEAQHGQRVAVDNFWSLNPSSMTLTEVWESVSDSSTWIRPFGLDEKGAIEPKQPSKIANTEEHVQPHSVGLTQLTSKASTAGLEDLKQQIAEKKVKLIGTFFAPPEFKYSGFIYRRLIGNETAFQLRCDFQRSTDGSVFLIVPASIEFKSAKAKVLKLSYCPLHAWSWFADVGNDVEVDVHIAMDAIWIDEKQKPHVQAIGAFDLTKLRFNLNNPETWHGSDRQARGWFPSVPRSHIAGGKEPSGTGTFWLEVQVTERDPSSGKNRLEKAATLVRDSRDDLVQAVRDLGKTGQ